MRFGILMKFLNSFSPINGMDEPYEFVGGELKVSKPYK